MPRYRYLVVLSIGPYTSQSPLLRLDRTFQEVEEAQRGWERYSMLGVSLRGTVCLVSEEDIR
jgi:negative regulator of sigma E activity